MTIGELIEQLEAIAEQYGDETEVRLAQQPHWPFECAIANVVAANPSELADEEDGEDAPDTDEDDETVVYIADGQQLGYLPEGVKQLLTGQGWH